MNYIICTIIIYRHFFNLYYSKRSFKILKDLSRCLCFSFFCYIFLTCCYIFTFYRSTFAPVSTTQHSNPTQPNSYTLLYIQHDTFTIVTIMLSISTMYNTTTTQGYIGMYNVKLGRTGGVIIIIIADRK